MCRQESCLTREIKQKQLEVHMLEEVATVLQYVLAHLPALEPEAVYVTETQENKLCGLMDLCG